MIITEMHITKPMDELEDMARMFKSIGRVALGAGGTWGVYESLTGMIDTFYSVANEPMVMDTTQKALNYASYGMGAFFSGILISGVVASTIRQYRENRRPLYLVGTTDLATAMMLASRK